VIFGDSLSRIHYSPYVQAPPASIHARHNAHNFLNNALMNPSSFASFSGNIRPFFVYFQNAL
jgi:hypothetical protein